VKVTKNISPIPTWLELIILYIKQKTCFKAKGLVQSGKDIIYTSLFGSMSSPTLLKPISSPLKTLSKRILFHLSLNLICTSVSFFVSIVWRTSLIWFKQVLGAVSNRPFAKLAISQIIKLPLKNARSIHFVINRTKKLFLLICTSWRGSHCDQIN
jgi:hypothetical protein